MLVCGGRVLCAVRFGAHRSHHRALARLPTGLYEQLVGCGQVSEDRAQLVALASLDRLHQDVLAHERAMHDHRHALRVWEREVKARRDAEEQARQAEARTLVGRVRCAVAAVRSRLVRGSPRSREPALELYNPLAPSPFEDLPRPIAPAPPRGVFLHGEVGVGKSLLMDLLFASTEHHTDRRLRVHYHSFMLRLHQLMHEYARLSDRDRHARGVLDPLSSAAFQLVGNGSPAEVCVLLCFDEFQLYDVGDAVVLKGLLQRLWKAGVCVVFTSNRPPNELNRTSLQRKDFAQFLRQLTAATESVWVGGACDYRMQRLRDCAAPKHVFFTPLGKEAVAKMDALFEDLTHQEPAPSGPLQLPLMFGRCMEVQRWRGGVARIAFDFLFREPRSAADYTALCHRFHTVLVEDVPQMSLNTRDAARRFIVFVDEAYNRGVRLVCSTAVPVDHLFSGVGNLDVMEQAEQLQFEGAVAKEGVGADTVALSTTPPPPPGASPLAVHPPPSLVGRSLFSGEDEVFAFRRALSRLMEMQTPEYWNKAALPSTSPQPPHNADPPSC